MAKPTERQANYLGSLGIQMPATKTACSSIIEMIEEGNRFFQGMSEGEKTAHFRELQREWIGRRVAGTVTVGSEKQIRHGHIAYLRPYRRREFLLGLKVTDPIEACIHWEDGKVSSRPLNEVNLA